MKQPQSRAFSLLVALLTLAASSPPASAQDTVQAERLLPEGLGVANHLEYSFDWKTKLEILENWLNIDYQYKIFSAGFRYEVFQPNDPNPSISRGKSRYADIAFKYVAVDVGRGGEGVTLTIGNYYTLFGRGLILKSYEDRTIRIDNNLLGVKIVGRYAGFTMTALSGQALNFTNQRSDVLHAIDLEYRGWKFLAIGGTFASHQSDAAGASRTRMASLRMQPRLGNLDCYGEYGVKQNNDIREAAFGDPRGIIGKALYGSAAWYLGSFSVVGEYKLYDNFGLRTSDQSSLYNNPPALRRDYSYILLNRHPSPTDPDNEQGIQLESNLALGDRTTLNGSYAVTRTLDRDSYYQRILKSSTDPRTALREAYGQVTEDWTEDLTVTGALGYGEELVSSTKSLTPILDVRYALSETHSLRAIIEHQQITNRITTEKYLDDVLTLEFLSAPDLSVSAVVEMLTREPDSGSLERSYWGFGQVGFKISDHTDGSILFGSRQAGNICVGGVCRYEPEFRGVELRLMSRF